MDIRKVKKLNELLEASDVAEIEIKEAEEATVAYFPDVRCSRHAWGLSSNHASGKKEEEGTEGSQEVLSICRGYEIEALIVEAHELCEPEH